MAKKKINKTDIAVLLSQWDGEFALLVPSRERGAITMTRWDGKDTGFLEW